jgi:ABC-type Co2+ transport system permease subunit
MSGIFDMNELIKRTIKYLIEGLVVAIAAFAIPKKSLNFEEIILLALTAASIFAILDTYIPSMGVSVKQGAAMGVGFNLVGFPGGL